MANPYFDKSELLSFDENYNTKYEEHALRARGEFLELFTKESLRTLTLKDYAIGLDRPTFCKFVEVKTRYWARITGSTAFKFGIYYGRTKSDRKTKYRFAARYGDSEVSVFNYIKGALISLIDEGSKQKLNFGAIDDNPLSPMFKAKILSLYFPKRFINICSSGTLASIRLRIQFVRRFVY